MSLNAAALRLLAEKGLTAGDIAELAALLEVRSDPTAAERMRRYRAKKAERDGVTVTRNVTANPPEVSPKDIYSNPLPSPPDAKASCPPLAEKVVQAWNDGPGKAGAITAKPLNADRRKALTVRLREHGEAEVFEAIANLAASAWHCGGNDRGWRANIGWLLKSPENFQKALELSPQGRAGPNEPTDLVQRILARKAA